MNEKANMRLVDGAPFSCKPHIDVHLNFLRPLCSRVSLHEVRGEARDLVPQPLAGDRGHLLVRRILWTCHTCIGGVRWR